MLTIALQTKWILRLMVMVYLLLSVGTANATFWCHSDESSSHLELNPVGKCWDTCSPDSGKFQQGLKTLKAEGVSSLPEDDCLDTPVFTSTLPTSKPTSLLDTNPSSSFDTTNLSHILELSLEIKGLVNYSLPAYLPEPHRLKVLRTAVLLR
ncbi:MAG TPA: hypothetical protein VKN62_07090 [Pelovirga sp.]|nr:hypothetical protein [Pelovirga sp.]